MIRFLKEVILFCLSRSTTMQDVPVDELLQASEVIKVLLCADVWLRNAVATPAVCAWPACLPACLVDVLVEVCALVHVGAICVLRADPQGAVATTRAEGFKAAVLRDLQQIRNPRASRAETPRGFPQVGCRLQLQRIL